MKKFWLVFSANWQLILLCLVSVAILVFVSFFQLESITEGQLSSSEVAAIESAASGQRIVENPLFLPFKLGQYALIKLGNESVYLFRAISALFGIAFVVLFYALARYWFSPRIAWLSSLALATSALFLHHSRVAVPDILLPLAMLGLLASAWWLHGTKHIKTALLGTMLIISTALYIPGIIWFVGLAIFAEHRHITMLLRKTPLYVTVLFALCGLVLLAPLGYAIVLNPSLTLDWLALPRTIHLPEIIKELLFVPASLLVRSLANPVHNLGRLPYIDLVTACLAILGAYAFTLRFSLVRTKTLTGAGIIAWLIIGISPQVSIVLLLPIIYLTVASGIMLLLHQWFTVFPNNPIARLIGLTLLTSVIGISIYYNVTRYFVAWSNNPVTQASFQESPPNLIQ